jgi:hypothetical protein
MAMQSATPFHRGEKFGTTTFRRNLKDYLQRLLLRNHVAAPDETFIRLILGHKRCYFPKSRPL